MRFTAVVVSHANEAGLRAILGNLLYQTRKPDEVLVYASETPGLLRVFEDFDGKFETLAVFDEPNLEDWGHDKRAKGVWDASGDYLGFFNDDDDYANDYLDKMLAAAEQEQAEIVYCRWNGQDCALALGSSTSGNFIVSGALARNVGYRHRHYEADGQFLEDLKAWDPVVAKVEESLYTHNAR